MEHKNVFAENLKMLMKLHRKTRRDVCKDLGFSYFTFTDWVNGRYYPRMDKVDMLAEYFGVTKADLIEEKSIETHPVEMAERHFEMVMDEDLNEIFDYLKDMDANKRKIAKGLIKSLAETKTEA